MCDNLPLKRVSTLRALRCVVGASSWAGVCRSSPSPKGQSGLRGATHGDPCGSYTDFLKQAHKPREGANNKNRSNCLHRDKQADKPFTRANGSDQSESAGSALIHRWLPRSPGPREKRRSARWSCQDLARRAAAWCTCQGPCKGILNMYREVVCSCIPSRVDPQRSHFEMGRNPLPWDPLSLA